MVPPSPSPKRRLKKKKTTQKKSRWNLLDLMGHNQFRLILKKKKSTRAGSLAIELFVVSPYRLVTARSQVQDLKATRSGWRPGWNRVVFFFSVGEEEEAKASDAHHRSTSCLRVPSLLIADWPNWTESVVP